MNLYPFSAIFDEKKTICSILTCMQQICSRMQQQLHFWVNWKLIILFYYLVSNDNVQTILCNFQWINQYAAFLTCMQQVCCSMQQQWFFRVYQRKIVFPFHKLSQMIIFSLFETIFNEKIKMLHFWPVCRKYAAVCSN